MPEATIIVPLVPARADAPPRRNVAVVSHAPKPAGELGLGGMLLVSLAFVVAVTWFGRQMTRFA